MRASRVESGNKLATVVKQWNIAVANSAECTYAGLEQKHEPDLFNAVKTKRRLLTREELLALEDQYPCALGNLLSLGAVHFRQSNRTNGRRAHRNGTAHRRKTVAA